jgi:hypothetical protein
MGRPRERSGGVVYRIEHTDERLRGEEYCPLCLDGYHFVERLVLIDDHDLMGEIVLEYVAERCCRCGGGGVVAND